MPVEQLTYSWARYGLSGYGMYQIVGASNLLRQDLRLQQLALKLCRYDRGNGTEDPISLGWIDARGIRFAFRRIFLRKDQAGHPGNFAAHILVGPVKELPSTLLLNSIDSPAWWRGPTASPEESRLPSFDVDTLSYDSPGQANQVREVLAVMLMGFSHTTFALMPHELAKSALISARILPAIYDGRSFSTFETSATQAWFNVCGVGSEGKDSRSELSAEALAAADYTLTESSQGAVVSLYGTTTLVRFRSLGALYHRLSQPGGLRNEDVVLALRSPEIIQDVLLMHATRDYVARALISDNSEIWRALSMNCFRVEDRVWFEFGYQVGISTAPQFSITLLERARSASSHMLAGLGAAALGAARQDPEKISNYVKEWPRTLIGEIMPILCLTENSDRKLLRAVAKCGRKELLFYKRIPIPVREALLEQMVVDGLDVPSNAFLDLQGAATSLLRNHPEALGVFLRSQPIQDALSILKVPDTRHYRASLAHLELFREIFNRLPPLERVVFASEVLPKYYASRAKDSWLLTIEDLLVAGANFELQDPEISCFAAMRALASNDAAPQVWHTIVREVAAEGIIRVGFRRSATDLPVSASGNSLAMRWRFDALASQKVDTQEEFTREIVSLAQAVRLSIEELAQAALAAGIRGSAVFRRSSPSRFAICWLADRIDNKEILLSRGKWRRRDSRLVEPDGRRINEYASRMLALLRNTDKRAEDEIWSQVKQNNGDLALRWLREVSRDKS